MFASLAVIVARRILIWPIKIALIFNLNEVPQTGKGYPVIFPIGFERDFIYWIFNNFASDLKGDIANPVLMIFQILLPPYLALCICTIAMSA